MCSASQVGCPMRLFLLVLSVGLKDSLAGSVPFVVLVSIGFLAFSMGFCQGKISFPVGPMVGATWFWLAKSR